MLRYVPAVDPWDSGAARLWRAAMLSGAVVALAAAAHNLGHGALPPVPALVLMAALTLPVTVVLTGRRVNGAVALAVLGSGQLLLHGAFGALTACGSVPALASGAGHLAHGMPAGPALAACSHATHAAPTGVPMLVLHAVATLAAAALLAGADRSLWRLLAKAVPRLATPAVPVWCGGPGVVSADPVLSALHLRRTPSRRGPPPRPSAPLSLVS